MIPEQLKQFIQQRVVSPQGQVLPMAGQMLPTDVQGATDLSKQSALGLTTGPVPRGDVAFARRLSQQQEQLKGVSMEDFTNFLKVAKQNLDIPEKIFKKMTIDQLIAEILGLAQKKR